MNQLRSYNMTYFTSLAGFCIVELDRKINDLISFFTKKGYFHAGYISKSS